MTLVQSINAFIADMIEQCLGRRRRSKYETNEFRRCWKGVTYNKYPKYFKKLPPLLEWRFLRRIDIQRAKKLINRRIQPASAQNVTKRKNARN